MSETATKTFSMKDVIDALNRAGDDIIEAIDPPAEGKRDVVNLLVNAGTHYLAHPQATLREAIVASYDGEDPAEVIEWCKE